MELFIDNKSGAPMYAQIYTQIKDQIIQVHCSRMRPCPPSGGLRGTCASA